MILVVSYSSAIGGAERLLVEFVRALEGECCLACPPGPLADAAGASGIRVFRLRARRLALWGSPHRAVRDLAGHARELRLMARDLGPQLIVAWSMRPALACALARVQVPVVFQHNDFLPGGIVSWAVRRAAARAALVIAPSHAVARELGQLEAPIRVVHPGVDVERFAASPTAPNDPPTIVVIGALVGWKRPDLALEAFALLRRRRSDVTLRFVGAPVEGAERLTQALRERAREFGSSVQFAGNVDDVRDELARAMCLLHCAEREPFGRVVLEALAAGRPVVVPDGDSGVMEIVDPSCARVYPASDAQAAADALDLLIGDRALAARMGAAGRSRAQLEFDRSAAQRQWSAEVRSVIAAAPLVMDAPSAAIVTVTHNSAQPLRAFLDSVDRHLPGVEVVVVDNASGDDSVQIARRRPGTTVLALPDNLGFGTACNRGIAAVHSPVTILVNPDVELLDASLLKLVAEVGRRDQPERLLAPLVLSPDGSRQDTVHPSPGSMAELGRTIVSPTLVPARWLAPWRSNSPRRVGWAVGCALVAQTETLRRLGPFDERLFLFGEDLELGLRSGKASVETWFWPSGRVIHHGAHATRPAFAGEPFELLARARRSAVASQRGSFSVGLDDAAQALTFASRLGVKRMLGRDATRERRQLEALAAARRAPE